MIIVHKTPHNNTYRTSLFDLSIPKSKKAQPTICFVNQDMAVALLIKRSDAKDILKRKVKNILDMNRKTTRFMLK
jgi:hypothetical protein